MPTWLHSTSKRGFTLIELMVSIMLIGLVMGLVVSGTQGGSGDVSATADRLAATMRFLHDKAATEGSYFKLVLDLDEQSYWVEATRDPYLLARPDETPEIKPEIPETEQNKAAPELADAAPAASADGALPKVAPLKPKEPTFTPVSDFLLKSTRLPDGVFFKDVFVEHLPTAAGAGRASIAFFPNGYVEEAIINLRDADDKYTFSLKTSPLLGRVDVTDGYRELGAAT